MDEDDDEEQQDAHERYEAQCDRQRLRDDAPTLATNGLLAPGLAVR